MCSIAVCSDRALAAPGERLVDSRYGGGPFLALVVVRRSDGERQARYAVPPRSTNL
jgi:hypothetical protein